MKFHLTQNQFIVLLFHKPLTYCCTNWESLSNSHSHYDPFTPYLNPHSQCQSHSTVQLPFHTPLPTPAPINCPFHTNSYLYPFPSHNFKPHIPQPQSRVPLEGPVAMVELTSEDCVQCQNSTQCMHKMSCHHLYRHLNHNSAYT